MPHLLSSPYASLTLLEASRLLADRAAQALRAGDIETGRTRADMAEKALRLATDRRLTKRAA